MKDTFNFNNDLAILNIAHLFGQTQQKIWNFMLSFAFRDINSQKVHKISLARLSHYLNVKDSNSIKEKLSGMVLKQNDVSNLLYYYFETLNISNDTIFYSYPEHLLALLTDQSVRDVSNALLQFSFSAKYALFLYEFCLYYDYLGVNQIITLHDFRNYLGIRPTQYNNFKMFKNRILIPALYEINTQTNLIVSIKHEKEANNIIGLKFSIKNYNQNVSLEFYKNRTSFLLKNIALARYYKAPSIVKDHIRQQYDLLAGKKFFSINDASYRDFMLQKFIAPFEATLLEKSL